MRVLFQLCNLIILIHVCFGLKDLKAYPVVLSEFVMGIFFISCQY